MSSPRRLAIVVSHPIQYYSPWFDLLAREPDIELKVFYLWNGADAKDPGFGRRVHWDLDLVSGHPHEFVPNAAKDPGTHHWKGLHNPELIGRLKAWKPDAILSFGYHWRTMLELIVSPRLASVPMLFRGDSHDLCQRSGLRFELAQAVRKMLFRRFSAALAVGKANTHYLRACGFRQSQIFFCPHAIDAARFQANEDGVFHEARALRNAHGITGSELVLLFVGKFESKKQPVQLVRAFLESGAAKKMSLLMVGAGELGEALDEEVLKSGIGGRVHIAGFKNQSAMPAVYAACDVAVLPSLGCGETWGLCVNEAMSLGKPVIVSTHVGCGPDLIVPELTGWTFAAGSQPALEDVLAHVAALPRDKLVDVGVRAQRHVARYSYAQCTLGLRAALASVDSD